ncbi:APC family permease [soil metagenome]
MNAPSEGSRLRGNLGTFSILLMVLAAAAPLSVWMSAGTTMAVTNGGAVPCDFVVAGAVLLVFSVGYTTMAHHIGDAGAFYAFVGGGLGRRMGVGAAYLALLTYITIITAMYAYIGVFISSLLGSLGVEGVPWWVSALAVNLVTASLGYLNVDLSTKILGGVLAVEVLVIVVLSLVILGRGAHTPEGLSLAGFTPELIFSGSVALGIMFAFGGFTGFESTAVYRDEARDPSRTIPRATYVAVISIALLYLFAVYALTVAWGPHGVQAQALAHLASGDLVQVTGQMFIGDWFAEALGFLIVTSLFASILAFHNVVARYLHSLARKGLMPGRLSQVHNRHGSPYIASQTTGALSAVLTVLWVAIGWKPIEQVAVYMIGIGTLGITFLFALTSIAVFFFFRRNKVDSRRWNTVVAPMLAFVALSAVAVFAVTNVDALSGTTDLITNGILSGAPLLALIVGLGVATVTMRSRRQVWAALDFSGRDPQPAGPDRDR